MVFAEYGVTGFMLGNLTKRNSVYPYQEEIPPAIAPNLTCYDCSNVSKGREAQTQVACLARKYAMYVVANMIERVPCSRVFDRNCPLDSHYQYNTNIVFNRTGCLIAKYHKFHMFAEEHKRLDRPKKAEHVFFDTEFGRFGTMICSDSTYKEPGITLVEKYGVEHILFPTAWDNHRDFVYMLSVQWQLAFASRMNVNFIAANVQNLYDYYEGSGIYSGTTTISFDFDTQTNKSKLLIGDIPIGKSVYDKNWLLHRPQSKHVLNRHDLISYMKFKEMMVPGRGRLANDVHKITIYNDTYNAVVLTGTQGKTGICQNQFCCSLDFVRNNTNETYVLGASEHTHHQEFNMYYENCVLYKCGNSDLKTCSTRQNSSTTAFSSLKLSGYFNTEYVFPTILPSEYAFKSLPWSYKRPSTYETELYVNSKWPLISASLIGRLFSKDPPWH